MPLFWYLRASQRRCAQRLYRTTSLQHRHAPCKPIRVAADHCAANHVIVNRVDSCLPVKAAVPAETFVRGVEHLFAPAVEDADFEVVNHALNLSRTLFLKFLLHFQQIGWSTIM